MFQYILGGRRDDDRSFTAADALLPEGGGGVPGNGGSLDLFFVRYSVEDAILKEMHWYKDGSIPDF